MGASEEAGQGKGSVLKGRKEAEGSGSAGRKKTDLSTIEREQMFRSIRSCVNNTQRPRKAQYENRS